MSAFAVSLSVTPVTLITLAATVTLHVAVNLPSTVSTVIVAVPALRAVTLPFSTFATVASLDFHVTSLFVAFEGATVAVSVKFSPSVSDFVVSLSVTPVTLITFDLTVTSQLADFVPAVAVIVALPAATAVTLPFWSTVATLSLLDFHVTALSVASEGDTVAVSVKFSPSVRVFVEASRVTSVTSTFSTLTVAVFTDSSKSDASFLTTAAKVTFELPSFIALNSRETIASSLNVLAELRAVDKNSISLLTVTSHALLASMAS